MKLERIKIEARILTRYFIKYHSLRLSLLIFIKLSGDIVIRTEIFHQHLRWYDVFLYQNMSFRIERFWNPQMSFYIKSSVENRRLSHKYRYEICETDALNVL